MQDTLYIAEPLYSAKLLDFDSEISFPPIKKIGITTGQPKKREKELLGTVSPVKVAIRKAWGNVDARALETMLHDLLSNCRLDGEYFWDGSDTLIDSVTSFIDRYHPEATLLVGEEDVEVKSADRARNDARYLRVVEEVLPAIEKLGFKYEVNKNRRGIRVYLNDYTLRLGVRDNDKYTLNVFSTTKTVEQVLNAFPGTVEPSHRSDKDPEDKRKKAVMGLKHLDEILACIQNGGNNG